MRKLIILIMLLWVFMPRLMIHAQDTAHIRLGHFATDLGALDLMMDQQVLVREIQPAAVTHWLEVPAGEHEFQLIPSGLTTSQSAVFTFTAAVEGWLTLPFIGSQGNNSLNVQQINENMEELTPGKTRFYFLNAMESMPIQIRVGTEVAVEEMTFNSAPWGTDQFGDEFPAQLVEFSHPQNVLFDVQVVTWEPSYSYLVVMLNPNESPIIQATNLQSSLRVAQLRPEAEAITIQVDGETVTAALSYQALSAPITILNGEHALDLFTSNGQALYQDENFIFKVGQPMVLLVTETPFILSEPNYADNPDLMSGETALVHFVHAIPDGPQFDLRLEDGTILIEGLAYGTDTALLELPTGRYNLLITVSGEAENIVARLPDTLLRGGAVYYGAISGDVEEIKRGAQRLFWAENCVRVDGCN